MFFIVFMLVGQTAALEKGGSTTDGKGEHQQMVTPIKRRVATPLPSGYNVSNDICVNCHSKTATDIEKDGGKHKTAIGCQDCHAGHPPMMRKIIPVCSQCHESKSHYKSGGCGSCHMNPHTPLFITFGKNVTEACVPCHSDQYTKLKASKSKHTAIHCSSCHDTHRRIPSCIQCHKPHDKNQSASDCKKCHRAHNPKDITYDNNTQSKDCATCHRAVYETQQASTFKHNKLNCVDCHQAKHKMIPECRSCHAEKHKQGMTTSRFSKCTYCHGSPHDLYNFKGAKVPVSAHVQKSIKK